MADMIKAPLVKQELVLRKCPNPRAIAACVATSRAMEWIFKNRCCYDGVTLCSLDFFKSRLPADLCLIVPECYDFDEVFEYLNSFKP